MNRTLEDALLNLTTMIKSCSNIKLEDRDSLKLQHMLNVADTLQHLTGDVRTRIEHALSGEKNEMASSNKTIGAVAAGVAAIEGVAGITAASFSVGGAGHASVGAGIAAATFVSAAGTPLAFSLAVLGAVAAPVVPITLASLYVWRRFRRPIQNERITKEPSTTEVEDLQEALLHNGKS
ncbi:hypothetical protein DPMN_134027 [Dreissena polymorpha]|uniref:Uncharacterized protein n=1 Tax=Dreissena polymorpha TaxID=45954 RepID=A0A9D4FVF9_DREPO|nr:hypothetical protein DPMN_134027 [Dreissena polymorpha]